MKLLDFTFATPAENLACDEALLDWCEEGVGEEVLRFWEPQDYFVVVGYANPVATEVNLGACQARNIQVLRRCSGGGTVLQGPGCLNYALVLKIEKDGPLHNISTANHFIMDRNRTAMESAIRNPQSAIVVQGHTDLTIGGLKFSGNSQRRRRQYLLFHGTFLLDFDVAMIESLLPLPSKQPDYRRNRGHADFLTNLNLPIDTIKTALARAWNVADPLTNPPLERMRALAQEKYATHSWSFKF